MQDLVATKLQKFAGRWLKVGELFKAKPEQVRLLKALGRAKDAPAAPVPAPLPETPVTPKRAYRRREATAEDGEPRQKRQYHRRDMTAE